MFTWFLHRTIDLAGASVSSFRTTSAGLARMLVPRMVRNGFSSVLQTSAGSRRLVAARNSGTNAKSETVSKS